jgi:hypothetical protein
VKYSYWPSKSRKRHIPITSTLFKVIMQPLVREFVCISIFGTLHVRHRSRGRGRQICILGCRMSIQISHNDMHTLTTVYIPLSSFLLTGLKYRHPASLYNRHSRVTPISSSSNSGETATTGFPLYLSRAVLETQIQPAGHTGLSASVRL